MGKRSIVRFLCSCASVLVLLSCDSGVVGSIQSDSGINALLAVPRRTEFGLDFFAGGQGIDAVRPELRVMAVHYNGSSDEIGTYTLSADTDAFDEPKTVTVTVQYLGKSATCRLTLHEYWDPDNPGGGNGDLDIVIRWKD